MRPSQRLTMNRHRDGSRATDYPPIDAELPIRFTNRRSTKWQVIFLWFGLLPSIRSGRLQAAARLAKT